MENREGNFKDLYSEEKKLNKNLLKEIGKLKKHLELTEKELYETKKKLLSYKNSETAKNGYIVEQYVCDSLNKNNLLRVKFKKVLGDEFSEFVKIGGNSKCDIKTLDGKIFCQVKKYKNNRFQQLDRHGIDVIIQNIPPLFEVGHILKDMCECPLLPNGTHIDKTKGVKKLSLVNYDQKTLDLLLKIFNENKRDILNYVFYGKSQELRPEYLIGVEHIDEKQSKIILFIIEDIINYLVTLDFKISRGQTVIILGNNGIISLQRKGGDGGKKSSNQMQIKIILSKLIDKVSVECYNL